MPTEILIPFFLNLFIPFPLTLGFGSFNPITTLFIFDFIIWSTQGGDFP